MRRLTFIFYLFFFIFIVKSYASSKHEAITGNAGSILFAESYSTFNEPWAMTFLPTGQLLVTEKGGQLLLFDINKRKKISINGVPKVAYGGQGGLGDVILDPQFQDNHWIYLSYVEKDSHGNKGAVVIRAELSFNTDKLTLENSKVIWRQIPKVSGSGHYSHRLAFGPAGKLFITSGDRQKQAPAQKWNTNLGKVIRLNGDGSVPKDNPFTEQGELAKTFWSIGHRNLLGISFDKDGGLWTHEMGPRDGDELNLTVAGDNYGWPIVSWGDQYSGVIIPDHDTRPEFNPPEVYWIPTIAPSGLLIYSGVMFPKWQGNALIGGLRSQSLLRIKIEGDKAEEIERFSMNKRIREVEQGPDGAIWILEDQRNARLIKLTHSK